uniref:Uncharacterized protein n=1 Tax=Branchiostoma floridae TaxID=7739 RepID=C3YPV7_BRAFL|eukprot:XP_002601583.1 hypothetical protein BRAFLDRAFT_124351 [Branchiostoma floridae]
MFKLLSLTLLVCSVFGVHSVRRQAGLISLPDSNIKLLRDAGLGLLQDEIMTAGNTLVDAAKLVNETQAVCTSTIETYLQGPCKTCVETKCQEKAESCSPGLWAFLLQQVEGFFSSQIDQLFSAFNVAAGVPGFVADVFHLDELGSLFVEAGTDVLETVQTVGNVFGQIGGDALDAGFGIWDGVTDVAGSLGEAVLGVGGSILGGIGDVGGALVDGFFGTIGGAIQGVGDLFGGLFNRRLRNAILQHHVKRQVRSEPTCSQLQNEGGNACLLYASANTKRLTFDTTQGINRSCSNVRPHPLASTMFKLLALTLLVCSVFGVHSVRRQAGLISLPDSNIKLLRDAGLGLLQDEIMTAGNTLVDAAKLPIDQLFSAFNVAAGVPGFVADVFHLDELGSLFVEAGTDVLDTFQTVGNVFGQIGGDAIEAGTGIWDGVTDVAGSLGEAVLGVGGSILGGIGDVGGALVDGVFGTIGGAIQGIGDLFGGLFNRRLRNAILQHHVKRQVRSEPTCSQLQNEGGNACLLYASSCGNVCDTKYLEEQYCSAFQAAMADYQGSMQQNYWVTTMPTDNQNYAINQVLVDGSSFDATVGGYTSATVTATLFGETYAFSLDSPLTMFDMTQAGREIAQKALDHYKALHPAPTTKKI